MNAREELEGEMLSYGINPYNAIKWAKIAVNGLEIVLKPVHIRFHTKRFFDRLTSIEYNSESGKMNLKGIVMLSDGSYFSRDMCTNKEYWKLNRKPKFSEKV